MKILQVHNTVAEKMQLYMPYNILPLHLVGHDQPIMRYPEVCFSFLVWNSWFSLVLSFEFSFDIFSVQIQAIVSALRNISGLPWPRGIPKKVNEDILDWLQAQFGFQVTYQIVCCPLLGLSCLLNRLLSNY